MSNDDIAQAIEDAHAHSYIAKGDRYNTIPTDALTLVLRELLAARAERDAAVAEAVRVERERVATFLISPASREFSNWHELADAIRRGE